LRNYPLLVTEVPVFPLPSLERDISADHPLR